VENAKSPKLRDRSQGDKLGDSLPPVAGFAVAWVLLCLVGVVAGLLPVSGGLGVNLWSFFDCQYIVF
jgi:hypothetical protein